MLLTSPGPKSWNPAHLKIHSLDFFSPHWSKLVEISWYPSSVFKPWLNLLENHVLSFIRIHRYLGSPSQTLEAVWMDTINGAHLSTRTAEAFILASADQKSVPIVLARSFCRCMSLWVIVLSGPLDSTSQDLPASSCHADCPWSCKAWKQSEHVSPQLLQSQGKGTPGSRTWPSRATKLQPAELQQLHMEKTEETLGCAYSLEGWGRILEVFCHCSLKMTQAPEIHDNCKRCIFLKYR